MRKHYVISSILALTLLSGVSTAQTDAVPFFRNLKMIIGAAETNNLLSLRGDLLSPPTRPVKVYDCTIKLEGFNTTFNEKDGVLQFEGVTANFQVANAKNLLDQKIRDENGFPGYANEIYTGEKPGSQSEKFEEMILVKKEGAAWKVLVCKRRNGAGYRIYLIE